MNLLSVIQAPMPGVVPTTHPLIPPHTGTLVLVCDWGGTRLRYCTIRNRKKEAATAMIKEDTRE